MGGIDEKMDLPSVELSPPEWIRAKEWTPEQQAQEFLRRSVLVLSMWESGASQAEKLIVRPGDVLVAPPPKSGTTWLTHICHQIRMGGSEPDFEAQEDVVPCLELAGIFPDSYDPNTMEQPASPRVFHTHLSYSKVPKGGKMITCMRDPADIILSWYRFLDSQLSLKGRVSLSVFCEAIIKGGALFKASLVNLVEWWEHRHDPDVLFFFFEDLKEDHAGCVRRIAKFMNVDCSEEVIDRVVHTTTHAEMARHHSKFDWRKVAYKYLELTGDDPPNGFVSRVRKGGGNSGEGKTALPQEYLTILDAQWKEIVTPKLGFKDLNEMRQVWKKERGY